MKGRQIRVLLVSAESCMGGAELSLLELVAGLTKADVILDVALPSEGLLTDQLRARGVSVHVCPELAWFVSAKSLPELLRSLKNLLWASWRMRRVIQSVGAQVVHANTEKSAFAVLGAARSLGLPLLWHVRDFPSAFSVRIMMWRGAIPVAVSGSIASRIREISGKSVRVVQNGVEISEMTVAPEEAPLPRIVTGICIAHWAPWKGHLKLLDAFSLARKRCSTRTRLLLVGEDLFERESAQTDAIMEKLSVRGEGVRVLGYQKDVREILAHADFLIHAAYPEPFGRVVVEALVSGVPVIALGGRHGPAEILDTVGGGVIVERHSTGALSDAIVSVVNNIGEHRRAARKASLRAKEAYSAERVAREISAIYAEIGKPV